MKIFFIKKYNILKKMTENFGLPNVGSICYFNAIIQSLYSSQFVKNNISEEYKHFFLDLQKNSLMLLKHFLKKLIKQQIYFGAGQECALECLEYLIEEFNLKKSLIIKYRRYSFCGKCKKKIEFKPNYNLFLLLDIINENHILKNKEELRDYICDCGMKINGEITNILTMSPKIFIIVLNKYKKKEIINYPKKIVLPGKEKTIIYKLFSVIKHFGNNFGGHYQSLCKRNGEWILFDDGQFTKKNIEYEISDFILFYEQLQ